MANVTFNNEMSEVLNNLESDFISSILETISSSKTMLKSQIVDVISKRGFNDDLSRIQLESVFEEYFAKLISFEEKRSKRTIGDVEMITRSIIRLADKKNIAELDSIFVTLSSEIVRKQNSKIYEDLNQQVISYINSLLTGSSLSNPQMELSITVIKSNVQRILNKYRNFFLQKVQECLIDLLKKYRKQILEIAKEEQLVQNECAMKEDMTIDYKPNAKKIGLEIYDNYVFNKPQQIPTDVIGEGETTMLLNELDTEFYENIDIDQYLTSINPDIRIVEKPNIDERDIIDYERTVLEQDPNVRRYIELMNLQNEQNAINQNYFYRV